MSSPVDGDKLMFPMIPGILYQDITGQAQLSADVSRAYLPGSFMVGLKKEDIQAIFWDPEGKRPASHPKTEHEGSGRLHPGAAAGGAALFLLHRPGPGRPDQRI